MENFGPKGILGVGVEETAQGGGDGGGEAERASVSR